jgi:hypothetical protein
MAAEEMGAARQGWGWAPRWGLGMKAHEAGGGPTRWVSGFGVVVVVGWEMGRAVEGHVELPAAPSPPDHRDPRGPAGRSHKTGNPSNRVLSRRAGRATGRPSAAAPGLEVRPSESSGRPNAAAGSPVVRIDGLAGPGPRAGRPGAARRLSAAAAILEVRPSESSDRLAVGLAGRAQQHQVWKSVREPARSRAGRTKQQQV